MQNFFRLCYTRDFCTNMRMWDENPGKFWALSVSALFPVMNFCFGLFPLWRSHSPHKSVGTSIKVLLPELSAVEGQNIYFSVFKKPPGMHLCN